MSDDLIKMLNDLKTPEQKAREKIFKRAKEIYNFDYKTGLFSWRHPGNGRRVDEFGMPGKVGKIDHRGHQVIRVDGRYVSASHLAWYCIYGEIPTFRIRHIDSNKFNHRPNNLERIVNKRKQTKDLTNVKPLLT